MAVYWMRLVRMASVRANEKVWENAFAAPVAAIPRNPE